MTFRSLPSSLSVEYGLPTHQSTVTSHGTPRGWEASLAGTQLCSSASWQHLWAPWELLVAAVGPGPPTTGPAPVPGHPGPCHHQTRIKIFSAAGWLPALRLPGFAGRCTGTKPCPSEGQELPREIGSDSQPRRSPVSLTSVPSRQPHHSKKPTQSTQGHPRALMIRVNVLLSPRGCPLHEATSMRSENVTNLHKV